MPKFYIHRLNGGGREVEADMYVDAGHEDKWVDFKSKSQSDGQWQQILRFRANDILYISQQEG